MKKRAGDSIMEAGNLIRGMVDNWDRQDSEDRLIAVIGEWPGLSDVRDHVTAMRRRRLAEVIASVALESMVLVDGSRTVGRQLAKALGSLSKGKRKHFSPEELARRTARLPKKPKKTA